MTVSTLKIESASIEVFSVRLKTSYDPDSFAVEFDLTSDAETSPSGSWTAGSWDGTWNSRTEVVSAFTPTIGASGAALEVGVEGSAHRLWLRVGDNVRLLARIVVT